MIKLEQVCKIYRMGGGRQVRALDGVSLSIARGDYVAIVGASGSGKTTLMHIMGCLDRPTQGSYLLNGTDVRALSPAALSDLRGKRIGFVFQAFRLVAGMNALQNAALPLLFQGVPREEREERAAEALCMVGLGKRMGHRPQALSGGQQQRVAIARAIVTQPAVLLADEPTGNLDPDASREVMRLFGKLHEAGNTVVLITHDHAVAAQAQRVVEIENGKLKGESK